jgi:hypothetical protein
MDEIAAGPEGFRGGSTCCAAGHRRGAPGDDALIDAEGVAKVAREQRNEIGETGLAPPPLPRAGAPRPAGRDGAAAPRALRRVEVPVT